MTNSFFHLLADRIVRSHRLILLIASVLTIVSIILITQLRMDSSLDSLMPSRDSQARQLLADLLDAGPQDVLVVVVSTPKPGELESAKQIVDGFVEEMASFPSIDHLEAKVTTQQKKFFSEVLLPHAGLFLSEQERFDLLERLSDSSISRQIKENKRLLLMPMQSGVRDLILKDPLGLRYLWLSRWFAQQSFAGLELEDGYLVDKSRSHLLVFIRPKESARNIAYTKRLMAAASAAAEDAIGNWRKSHPAAAVTPKITFAGGYAIAQEDEALTRRDLQSSLLISFLGVNILFFLVFRKLRFLFLMLLPLAMAVIWTFGLLQLIVGHLNILTGAFAAVLLGLGIDFAIHLLNLYAVASQSQDQSKALHLALTQSGGAILMGGLTTALAFFALSISSFRGFQELGIITGIGILACLAAMLVVLPALLVWQQGSAVSPRPAKPIPNFGLNYLIWPAVKHPRRVVWFSLVLLATLGIASLKISFDDDLRSLRPQQAGRMAVEKEVESILGGASGYVLLVMQGKDEETLLNQAWRLDQALATLQGADRLSHYRSILSYWPAPESQRLALDFYQRHAGELNPDRIEATFKKALQENGFQFLPEYTSYLNWLRTLVNPKGGVDRQTFERAHLEQLLDLFLVGQGPNRKLLTFVYPRQGLWDKKDLASLSMDLRKTALEIGLNGSEWRLAGWPILTERLKGLVWRDLADSLILAGAAIAVALLLALRNPFSAALAAIPLVGGIVAMLGIMALLSIKFNYANFIVLPLIVGIGIDDGIHIVHRWRQEADGNLTKILNQIGRAIVLTSLTTIMGFGSLVSSHYPGLRSIGWVTALGIITCLLAALLLLPAVLTWWEQRMTRRKGETATGQ
jgi:predicted RND superfamily exporter protein